jgi:branched-chain amino acid transport system substrate-binding protein
MLKRFFSPSPSRGGPGWGESRQASHRPSCGGPPTQTLPRQGGGLILSLLLLATPTFAAEPIRIGDLNSYTAIPAFTVPYRNGWQLALDEVNKAGGVLGGRKLEVISRDDGARPATALAAVDELAAEHVVAVIGTTLTNVALAVEQQRKLPFIAVLPLSDALVWSQGNRTTFHLRPNAHMHAALLAEQAAKLPAKRWASVAPDYEQGRELQAEFKTLLKAKRPDVTFVAELWSPLGKLDAAASIGALEQARPEAVFNATFGGDLARLLAEGKGFFAKHPVVSPLLGEPEYLDSLADEAPVGWIVTGYPWTEIKGPEHRKFVDAYMAAYDEDPRLAALLGYDALKAVAAALDKAGATDPDKLVAALEGLTFNTPTGPISFRAADHQATLGSWTGKIAVKDGAGTLTDWVYTDGAKLLPSAEEARKLRPGK